MADDPKIEERENGPLMAFGVPDLRGPDGPIDAKPAMALCRCGASQNKPFCDGSHNSTGFQSRGGDPAGRDRLIAYKGKDVTVTYNPMLCSHAAECGRLAKHVFNPAMKPWVQPDEGSVEEIADVVAACPSGALSLAAEDGSVQHRIPDGAGITLQANGPYWVRNIDPPVSMDAAGGSKAKYVLCRCGLSGNKPFCDGSHRDKGWKDTT